MSNQGSVRGYRFGTFELDLRANQLRKDGLTVRVQEQSLRILTLLASRSGGLVTREEFRQDLWDDGTFVDFDHGLNAAINKLREALGDSASNPRFIATVPRRGYRLIAPVEPITDLPAQPAAPPRIRRWLLAAALLPLAAATAWYVVDPAKNTGLPPREAPLTTYPGNERYAAFSPDGNQIAFSWTGPEDNNSDIYVVVAGSEQPLRLTDSPADELQPKWSPDGTQIAFLRKDPPSGFDVILVSPLGGGQRKVARLDVPPIAKLGWEYQTLVAWLPDSSGLVISDRVAPAGPQALFRLSLRTGGKLQLTTPPPETPTDDSPAISPGGQTLAFRRGRSQQFSTLNSMPLKRDFTPAAPPTVLASHPGYIVGSLAWTADARFLWFLFGPQHGQRLRRVDAINPRNPEPAQLGAMVPMELAFAAARPRLVYTRAAGDINVYSTPILPRPEGTRLVTRSTAVDHLPAFSPDGQHIAFVSNRSGATELWRSRRDGSSPVRLTNFEDAVVDFPRWSPDGQSLLFAATVDGEKQVFRVDAGGGVPVKVAGPDAGSPAYSRDGQWIYYGHQGQIWKTPAAGGAPTQVTRNGGLAPVESRDGQSLYFTRKGTGDGIWMLPVSGGSETLVVKSVNNAGAFDVAGNGIYFISESDSAGRAALSFYSFVSGATSTIHPITKMVAWGLSVSPASDEILYTCLEPSAADLILVDNFH